MEKKKRRLGKHIVSFSPIILTANKAHGTSYEVGTNLVPTVLVQRSDIVPTHPYSQPSL